VAKATKNTVFKVIFFKEALSHRFKGLLHKSSENQGKVWTLTLGRATDILRRAVIHVSSQTFSQQPISLKEVAKADLYPLMADTKKIPFSVKR
jgi:hypothetical protein